MNISNPLATTVAKVHFGTFTDEDVSRLSVLQVTAEKIFDNLQVSQPRIASLNHHSLLDAASYIWGTI